MGQETALDGPEHGTHAESPLVRRGDPPGPLGGIATDPFEPIERTLPRTLVTLEMHGEEAQETEEAEA